MSSTPSKYTPTIALIDELEAQHLRKSLAEVCERLDSEQLDTLLQLAQAYAEGNSETQPQTTTGALWPPTPLPSSND
jgi:hypothetical protein